MKAKSWETLGEFQRTHFPNGSNGGVLVWPTE
jgi:hypothetical protein